MSDLFVLLNGQFTSSSEAKIPVAHSGIFYGTGCFETLRTYKSRFFKLEQHIERLHRGLKYLGSENNELPRIQKVKENILSLLKHNNLMRDDAKVRIQYVLAEEGGYASNGHHNYYELIEAQKFELKNKPLSLCLSSTRVIPAICRPSDSKLSNMLHYRNAMKEARAKDFDDAIMLTTEGFISETSISNIFWIKNRNIFTPAQNCDLLPGIMRNTIIDLLEAHSDFQLITGKFNPEILFNADLVFTTNSVQELRQVQSIDDQNYLVNDKRFFELSSCFEKVKAKNLSK